MVDMKPQMRQYSLSGTKRWILNGRCHREDGPAVENSDGPKYWYQNDRLHREDGPAVEWEDGVIEWWVNGCKFSFAEWMKKVNISPEEKTLLVLKYG